MIDCRLTISSRGGDWKSDVCQRARMEMLEGGASIEYFIEGDGCRLVLLPDFAEQTRKGIADIKMTFRPLQQTSCIICDSALRGGFKIFCTRYKLIAGAKGVDARIEYLSGDDGEKVSVKIRATALLKDD